MSRRCKRKKINKTVMSPDDRRVTEPDFRGSTIDYQECQVIDIDENFTIGQLVDTYAATVNCYYTAYIWTCKAYVIENRAIRVTSAAIDMDSIAGETGCMLVFRNCVLTDSTGNMSLAVSGAGIAFEDCTFGSGGSVNMTLAAGTSVVLDRCAHRNKGMLAVRGTGGNDVSLNACGMMAGVFLERVGRIDIKGELPSSVAVGTAEKVSITGITKPSSGSTMHLTRIANEICLEHCRFKRAISIDNSMCSIRVRGSSLDEMKITGSIVAGFPVIASAIRLLIGYFSVMPGGVIDDGKQSIACSATTNCLGFPEVPVTLYKKVNMRVHSLIPFSNKSTTREVILRLSVPGKAQKHYSDSFNGKFRVSEATVEAVLDLTGNPIALPKYCKYTLESLWYSDFLYEVGKTAYPKFPFSTSDEPCASGIHGFRELQKAVEYI